MANKYYEEPTQVIFIEKEVENPHKIGGIAYHDYVICGECGAIASISEVEIIDDLSWCDISEEIGGYEIY